MRDSLEQTASILSSHEGESLFGAPEAILKGLLEGEVPVSLLAGPRLGAFAALFRAGQVEGVADLLRRHEMRLSPTPTTARAVTLAHLAAHGNTLFRNDGAGNPPTGPIGISDIPFVVYNGLVKDPADVRPLEKPIFACLGNPLHPRQIGLFDENGLRRYDFIRGLWTHQEKTGVAPVAADEDPTVIQAWESYRVHRGE